MSVCLFFFFFFNDTATTEIYTRPHTLSLHDALPITVALSAERLAGTFPGNLGIELTTIDRKSNTSELQSHGLISYAVFCLKKKKIHSVQAEVWIIDRSLDEKEDVLYT